MIIVDCEQGSEEWKQARLGVITASEFNQVMTTKLLKPSSSDYIYSLAAEIISGEEQGSYQSDSMSRGNELEESARLHYAVNQNASPKQVGFIYANVGKRYGCSPDSLICENGGLEIKCPSLKKHIQYFCEGKLPDEYKHQVWGCLFVTGRKWWDFMSYHPDYPEFLIRVERDEAYQKWAKSFSTVLKVFIERLDTIAGAIAST